MNHIERLATATNKALCIIAQEAREAQLRNVISQIDQELSSNNFKVLPGNIVDGDGDHYIQAELDIQGPTRCSLSALVSLGFPDNGAIPDYSQGEFFEFEMSVERLDGGTEEPYGGDAPMEDPEKFVDLFVNTAEYLCETPPV